MECCQLLSQNATCYNSFSILKRIEKQLIGAARHARKDTPVYQKGQV